MEPYEDLEKRVRDLEARVEALEGQQAQGPSPTTVKKQKVDATTIIELAVTNKRLDTQDYQNFIFFDCTFTAASLAKPSRAIKGTIELCDLFGEPKFLIDYTLNEPLDPNSTVEQAGVGFEFNEYISEHTWLYGADLNDVTTRFRVTQILYADSSSENVT